MADNKTTFTNAEIKKALECCKKAKNRGDCEELGCPACVKEGCVYYLRTDEDYEGVVFAEIGEDLVDLISHLEADKKALIKTLAKKDTEIELLRGYVSPTVQLLNAYDIAKAKAEAINYAIEWLQANFYVNFSPERRKQLVKEMVGDAE